MSIMEGAGAGAGQEGEAEDTLEDRIWDIKIKIAVINELNLFLSDKFIKKALDMQKIIEYGLKPENEGNITVTSAGEELFHSYMKALRRISTLRRMGLVVQKRGYYKVTTEKTGLPLLKEILEKRYLLLLNEKLAEIPQKSTG